MVPFDDASEAFTFTGARYLHKIAHLKYVGSNLLTNLKALWVIRTEISKNS